MWLNAILIPEVWGEIWKFWNSIKLLGDVDATGPLTTTLGRAKSTLSRSPKQSLKMLIFLSPGFGLMITLKPHSYRSWETSSPLLHPYWSTSDSPFWRLCLPSTPHATAQPQPPNSTLLLQVSPLLDNLEILTLKSNQIKIVLSLTYTHLKGGPIHRIRFKC